MQDEIFSTQLYLQMKIMSQDLTGLKAIQILPVWNLPVQFYP